MKRLRGMRRLWQVARTLLRYRLESLVEGAPLGAGRWLRFTQPLRPADMPILLDGDFPAQLRHLLAPALSPPTRVAAADYAPLPGGRAYDQQPEPLRPWLALLIVLLQIGLILLG